MKKAKYFLLLFIFILLIQFSIFYPHSFANTDISTYSKACLLMEVSTGKVLYEKNSHTVSYPASTTKIMTAILALEKCSLTDVATVSHDAIFSVPPSYSHANLKEGEQLSIEQLLHVLLIPSANDAANVLAEHISGSVENFSILMNEKAKEIGCLNTNFVNPNGIHNEKHTTTAYDLALMGRYAIQNSTFRDIVQKTRYTLPTTNKYTKTDRIFNTTNDLLRENNSTRKDNYYYSGTIGIKTGYTDEAGSCIVACAEKDGMEVIVVILGGKSTKDGLSQRYLDCKNLFNYAFNNYSMKTVNEKNSILKNVQVSGATRDTKNLNVLVKDKISILQKLDESTENLDPEIMLNEPLKAPISANSVVGTITYKIDDQIYSSELIAETSVIASGFFSILVRIILISVTLYLIYLLLKKPKNGKLKKNKSKKTYKKKSKSSRKNGKHGSGNFRFTALSNYEL